MKNLSVFNKMLILIISSLVLLIGTGTTGIFGVRLVNDAVVDTYSNYLISVNNLQQARGDTRTIRSTLYEILVYKQVEGDTSSAAKQKLAEYEKTIETALQTLEEHLNHYTKTPMILENEAETQQKLMENYEYYVKRIRMLTDTALKNDAATYTKVSNSTDAQLSNMFRQQLDDLSTAYVTVSEQKYQQSQKDSNQTKLIIYAVIGMAIIITSLLGFWIARLVSRPIRNIREVMQLAQNGDLTVQSSYHSKDELGQLVESFNIMIRTILTSFRNLILSSNQVVTSSQEVSASADATSTMTQKIVESIEQVNQMMLEGQQSIEMTTQTMSEMNHGMSHVVNQTQGVSDTTTQMVQQVVHGNEQSRATIEQMETVNNSFVALEDVLHNLSERSSQIDKIIGVMSEIANQTSLLSLNASIEAARAGEHGQGFMVVATEVRKLAEQSSKSATEITRLIQDIQANTNGAVSSMNVVKHNLGEGMNRIYTSGEIFSNVKTSVEEIAGRIEEVFSTMEEMLAGSEQVSATMSQFNSSLSSSINEIQEITASTEEQMAAMEEVAAASVQLLDMAASMQADMNKFKV